GWAEDDSPLHWSYIKPERPPLPEVQRRDWPQTAVDAFVLAKIEDQQPTLAPSAPADPATLLRRVYLDLIGLPPSVEDVDAFLNDPSVSHYEQIVDQLLNSPRYGEKWARHWLDLARYADSNGYQADQFREMWAYRDWVVDALNRDMPFDQFTIEQIAGDLLPQPTLAQQIATGFHRCTTCNVEAGVDPEENRVNQIVDRVNTTGIVWLGTSLECAQCHNHKYDPFTQQDYYELFAFFNQTPLEVVSSGAGSVAFEVAGPKMELPLTSTQREELDRLQITKAEVDARIAARRAELANSFDGWAPAEPDKLPQEIQQLLSKPPPERSDEEQAKLREHQEETDKTLGALMKDLTRIEQELTAAGPPTTLVMVEQDEPRMTAIFKRGDFLQPGQEVSASTPSVLHPLQRPTDGDVGRATRLDLARWIVSEENPLVARVTVNRWWAEIFGRGLVETVEDFGTQGDPPTHPELLDWLAVEFMSHGWSMKHIYKLIVMSAVYQQDSRLTSDAARHDPDNWLLARGPRFRLPAESIRDNALVISGLVSDRMGGPPVYPPQPPKIWRHIGRNAPKYEVETDEDRFRRGLYVVWRRSAAYPSFVNFDAPDRAACCVKRSRTNTPLQALTLMNDPAYFEMAAALAQRMATDLADGTDRDRIEYGFRRTVARQPSSDEVQVLLDLLESERARLAGNATAVKKLIGESQSANAEASRSTAWVLVANVLLNLDETITKD
ncbi:MAG: DUF1553 domain-containing protein, partial [Planctomycetaceae bacterium]|nr:DUF1553 domain-containing protein [Planctomycetaceae bacterium]